MKLKDQLLLRCLAVVAALFALFMTLLTLADFSLQLSRERESLALQTASTARGLEAAAVSYALQSIAMTDELAAELVRQTAASALYSPDGAFLTGVAAPVPPAQGITLHAGRLYAFLPVTLSDQKYLLLCESDLSGILQTRRTLLAVGTLLSAVLTLLCAAALALIARRLTSPVEQLAAVSRRLSDGDLSIRAPVDAGYETGELARAFNRMADSLTGQIDRQQRFIADLTHEMKTPLTAVIGHADLIRSGRTQGEETTLAAHRILTEAKRLNSLSLRLIDLILMEREEPQMTVIHAQELLHETADALRPEAERLGISLSVACPDVMFTGDVHLIRILISNLADNALKSGAAHVTLEGSILSGRVTLTVRDDGRGMDTGTLLRVTEPFYRADKSRSRQQGGAGLGLALCETIVRLHGTQLFFDSAPGRGAVVSVPFARKEEDSHAEA